ncbi:Carbamoyl-phosphate synthase L chain ATP-binding protein [Alkalidesulfovibrio alkalitolerans DSM 16529]|uniref:pyruvate carboxylase n=1 Tax=Alkalidesulfovibrio alkalitolerans DSM 16529 TaxID=1121439 RepID=S7U9W1_9BACT|nr:pyruvate carboxylase [Alkalidesulfovibrio alkalitolerans]EPR30709.1 Carbamoyl-phosphate synthase L chain ATP-binding protein [Alkalidesulfovibrio alkalitolerans DSM 16529]
MAEKTYDQVVAEIKGKSILVANRGIPARRIVRTIREMAQGVAIMTATDLDKASPTTAAARELLLLGPDPRAYLDIDLIVKKAAQRGIIAIHPGWGFAAEDDSFPKKCADKGIIFIGPTAEAMRLLGNKVEVRNLAMRCGVPVVPGSEGSVTVEEARRLAHQIGFPIMLKAEGGGGGRGIYEVFNDEQLESSFVKASALAQASFGNPRLFVEKLLTSVRHIEIQVIADKHGNVFCFDERDCTVQRNHQKLVEITPSPWKGMTPELRARLKEYSERLVREVGYHSLCTVEFLVDASGAPYLIEVNTRLQVEHGITECRYGVDLVEEQIAVAFGAKLRFNERNTKPRQWAIQVRINCEDPRKNFSPNSGLITRYVSPGGQGIRLDSCISMGYEFPSNYDSAAALLIAYGRSWGKVCATLERGLREYIIGGLKTTIPFHLQIVKHPRFISADFDTNFVRKHPELYDYTDVEPEELRISRLVAEISAKGYNPYVQLGEYRGVEDKRLGRFEPVCPPLDLSATDIPYPRGDRQAILDKVRDTRAEGVVHFSDTTTRDITQSNSGNRFRLGEDRLIGPYLDLCNFFSLENGGGAHFHVAMLANMTYPFSEAHEWNVFAPRTLKQILIRSTNVLGYKPQPRNLMRRTGEMICEEYDVIRCFDFLNHTENMLPFAEVALSKENKGNIWQPAISLSWAKGFTVEHYLGVADELVRMSAKAAGVTPKKVQKMIILGLKDMAGVCPPAFLRELISGLRKKFPDLVLHYHRHCTDGLFVPAVGAAVQAGAHITDVAMGAAVRWYGQGEVLSTAAYIEQEFGLTNILNKNVLRDCNFVLKQIMPYYDRYTAPYFQGIDYDVVEHGMPGGATSSSQEGAMKQGYIHLLPYMLKFLAGTRKIVRYHDVTPGSQITWNTAFLAVTGAFKRGGERAVRLLLEVLEAVTTKPEGKLTPAEREDRLTLYADSNDAFRQLLLGRYGRLPLGWPPDWVYESAFGAEYREAIATRTTDSPLDSLPDVDIEAEEETLTKRLERRPTPEELLMYLNHPGDALKTIDFRSHFGDPNNVPLDVWFEGLESGREMTFTDSSGKPHVMSIIDMSPVDVRGVRVVRYVLDSENLSCDVRVAEAKAGHKVSLEMADPDNPYHVAAPSSGDLWVMHVSPGDFVKKGEELLNISIMKQEKSVHAPMDAMVKRVLKDANYQEDKRMVPVKEGELLIELGPVTETCPACAKPIAESDFAFCPRCGAALGADN